MIITIGGFLSSQFFLNSLQLDRNIIAGVFSGSLTSSPGLATALENTRTPIEEANIGLGYALAYVPGVLAVIFSMYLIPLIFKIDIDIEKKELSKKINNNKVKKEYNFDFKSYALVVILGITISSIKINWGPVNNISLGITGGTLLSSLFFGVIGKFGNFNFNMKSAQLKLLQKIGLLLFLASIGLRYGFMALNGFNMQSLLYFFIAFGIAFLSILTGFLIGRYIFKMNWIILSGAICGGMTSTPGISSAIEATNTDDVIASYGAVYPFALFSMVLLLIIGL